MSRMTPCLWFDNQAEEAANFYTSIFRNSRILATRMYGAESAQPSGKPVGSVMTVSFELDGQTFLALNGGPVFSFSPAISLMWNCKDQAEIDHIWDRLSADGGEVMSCGWVKDKFGVCWQIIPEALTTMMESGDEVRTDRMMAALLKMQKLDLATLQSAFAER